MNCRSCGEQRFGEVLDLGEMPLVNNLLRSPDEHVRRYPLHVVFCRACSLAQLTATPPPNEMFDEYLYFSSQSQTMVAHAQRLVDRFVKPRDRVLEIASNDGYLLSHARMRGAHVLGIEPARNIAAHAQSKGIPTRCAYFNREYAQHLRDEVGLNDVIFANNVLAHVPDPNELMAGMKTVLAEDGVAHVEVPSLLQMIRMNAFDTIYHEHYSYFSAAALHELAARNGLRVTAISLIDIHGGSLHAQLQHSGDDREARAMVAQEIERGVKRDDLYAGFARKVSGIRDGLFEAMSRFPRVAALGAAAKGIVLLNAFGLSVDRVPWIADVSPHKQGRYVPGTLQTIVSPDRLVEEAPDAVILLPWNIREELFTRNHRYRDQGGKFIVPIPEVEVV